MRRSAVLVVLVLLMGLAVAWSQQPREMERVPLQSEQLVLLKQVTGNTGYPVGYATVYLPLVCPTTRDSLPR